jgi:hypothetical protein
MLPPIDHSRLRGRRGVRRSRGKRLRKRSRTPARWVRRASSNSARPRSLLREAALGPHLTVGLRYGLRRPGTQVDSAHIPARDEEPLQLLGKLLRRGDEMSGARREQPLGVESDGQGIADALESGRVIA